MDGMRARASQGLQAGDSFEISRTFSLADTLAFGDLTRDYNPVHYDEQFCREKDLEGPICHGLLVAGMICQVGGQIAWLASGMSFRFRRPVYPGDTITCRVVISEVDAKGHARAEAQYHNQHGQLVQEASLRGYLPTAQPRQRLADMAREGDPTNPLAATGGR